MCTRAEWTRATVTIGTTAEDQVDYPLPPELAQDAGERILELSVGGENYKQSSAAANRDLNTNRRFFRGRGLYWISFTSDGDEQITLYPPPGDNGLPIEVLAVLEPEPLVGPGSLVKLPRRFAVAIRDYVASQALGALEDDIERREYHESKFEAAAADLNSLRTSRQGRGGVQMEISGVHY